jgi:hypothetical protein
MNSRWRTTKGQLYLFIPLVGVLILMMSLGGIRPALAQNNLPLLNLVGNAVRLEEQLTKKAKLEQLGSPPSSRFKVALKRLSNGKSRGMVKKAAPMDSPLSSKTPVAWLWVMVEVVLAITGFPTASLSSSTPCRTPLKNLGANWVTPMVITSACRLVGRYRTAPTPLFP